MELIDIGANLTHDSFDADRQAVLDNAIANNVARMIVTGASVEGSVDALALAQRHPGMLYATAGVHPHHASDYSDSADEALRNLCNEPEVVAVGECGLDYFRNFSPVDDQRRAFEQQLAIAIDTDLPVFLHQRDAHEDFVEILAPKLSGSQSIVRAVAHCFTAGEAELKTYLDLGLYIGITGWICDERRGLHLRDIVSMIPDNRLLLETDAPYLLPRTLRPKPSGRRNEPKYLPEVLRVVAEARQQTSDEVAEITTRNACYFFGLSDKEN